MGGGVNEIHRTKQICHARSANPRRTFNILGVDESEETPSGPPPPPTQPTASTEDIGPKAPPHFIANKKMPPMKGPPKGPPPMRVPPPAKMNGPPQTKVPPIEGPPLRGSVLLDVAVQRMAAEHLINMQTPKQSSLHIDNTAVAATLKRLAATRPRTRPVQTTVELDAAREQVRSLERLIDSLNEQCVLQRKHPNGVYLRSVLEMGNDVTELYVEISHQRKEYDRLEASVVLSEVKEEASSSSTAVPGDPRARPPKRSRTVANDPYL